VRTIVGHLTSPACLPRVPGSPGGREAARFLEERLVALGLAPAGEDGYRQAIPPIGGTNLLARIAGSGAPSDRVVLLAAHFDACDPYGQGMPGADDNAAGVAVVLAAAERLLDEAGDLDRSVLVALFDAEEPPYFTGPAMGSQWFVDHPTVDLDAIDMMICLDLVGRSLGAPGFPEEVRDSVFVLGAEKSEGTGALLDALPSTPGLFPRRAGNHILEFNMSDYDAFMKAGIPFLFYSTGRSGDYHQMTDTADKLDYDKMTALAAHLADVVAANSTRPEPRVVYHADGEDDRATLASLEAVVAFLAGLDPAAGIALTTVKGLAAVTRERPLSPAERTGVRQLVAGIESALG
jgi:Zn-dependent M28 family amino/carboxypeptidase